MQITLTLTSLTQADALRAAIELFCDMETDRSRDGEAADFTKKDGETLKAACALASSGASNVPRKIANPFAPASTDYKGAYALAVRTISIAVRKHLTYGFFTWQRVRSYVRAPED